MTTQGAGGKQGTESPPRTLKIGFILLPLSQINASALAVVDIFTRDLF